MAYNKVIAYGDFAEVYRYEHRPRGGRIKRRGLDIASGKPEFSDDGKSIERQNKPPKIRRQGDAARAAMAFRRVVAANLRGGDRPILVTCTYREPVRDILIARSDFNAFARRMAYNFGGALKYVVVAEFQDKRGRGAVHFHALFWGIDAKVALTERSTRLLAKLWGLGFVDAKATDGSVKLAGYLAKYMKKSFADIRLSGKKAYICSRNILRPEIHRDVLLSPFFWGVLDIDLSTGQLDEYREYEVPYLGKAIYQRYKLLCPTQ